MSKYRERLRTWLKRLGAIKTWQLIVVLLLTSIVAAIFLRLNNLGMMERRDAVIAADEKGDVAQLEAAVNELQRYVTRHMNTNLDGGFYLTKSYERAREVAMSQAGDSSNPNSAIYNQASIDCQSGSERARYGGYVPCVLAKVGTVEGQGDLVSNLKLPPSELYKINFVSPLVSLDFAGLSVLFAIFIVVVIVARLTGVAVVKILLRRRYSHV
ncbi:MAG TPA: hypothetical protein PKD68_01660 [Candidatus Saccharibacteria bacterium]|nr:hypothetical protein [Candidatus Saccharibacteria bacterium]